MLREWLGDVVVHDVIALLVALITAGQAITVTLLSRQNRRVRSIDRKTTDIADGLRPLEEKEEG